MVPRFRMPFPPGDRVTFNGKECVCQRCSLPASVSSSAPLTQGLWSKWGGGGWAGGAARGARGGARPLSGPKREQPERTPAGQRDEGSWAGVSGVLVPLSLSPAAPSTPCAAAAPTSNSHAAFGPALARRLQEAFLEAHTRSAPQLIPDHLGTLRKSR